MEEGKAGGDFFGSHFGKHIEVLDKEKKDIKGPKEDGQGDTFRARRRKRSHPLSFFVSYREIIFDPRILSYKFVIHISPIKNAFGLENFVGKI